MCRMSEYEGNLIWLFIESTFPIFQAIFLLDNNLGYVMSMYLFVCTYSELTFGQARLLITAYGIHALLNEF